MTPARCAPGAALVLVCTALAAGIARAEPRPVVEYLTIAANEAGASGGHAALRLGERVFHFQAQEGRLQLEREPWSDFRFRYRVVENRTLHASRLAFSPEAAAALDRHFDRLWWIEVVEREHLAALREDVQLLEALARRARGERAELRLPALGFFARRSTPAEAAGSAGAEAIHRLRERIARERGREFARERLERVEAALRALPPPAEDGVAQDAAVPTQTTFSQRYAEALVARRALRVLRDGPPLRAEAWVQLPEDVGALVPAERRALRTRRDALEVELVRLVASQRPDWGFAFALGQARLAAMAESLASGRLVVLDAFAPDAPRLDAAAVRQAAEPLRRWIPRRRAALAAARRALGAQSAGEGALARLEAAASRYAELARALGEGRSLRVALGARAPRGLGSPDELPLPDFAAAGLEAPLAAARDRLRAARASSAPRYEYDLVTNNCVTAIFREIAAALRPAPGALDAAPAFSSGAGLLGALRFVPFVSARVLRRSGRVVAERTLPSYRSERLAALRVRERGWLVALRESNTLTSTLYRPNPLDSRFVFFTDGSPWSRPVLGAVNVAAGLAHSVSGLLRLPWDRGRSLARGARGLAASLPELVFVNVRKGSFPFAEPTAAVHGTLLPRPRRPS